MRIEVDPGGTAIRAERADPLEEFLAVYKRVKTSYVDKVEDKQQKLKVGGNDAVLQEVGGTFLKKVGGPFDPNAKSTPVPGYKQLYVVFETKDGITASAWRASPTDGA